jgi:hypothetical protein
MCKEFKVFPWEPRFIPHQEWQRDWVIDNLEADVKRMKNALGKDDGIKISDAADAMQLGLPFSE